MKAQSGTPEEELGVKFITRNYNYEDGSISGILGLLKLEPLKKTGKDYPLVMLNKGLYGKVRPYP